MVQSSLFPVDGGMHRIVAFFAVLVSVAMLAGLVIWAVGLEGFVLWKFNLFFVPLILYLIIFSLQKDKFEFLFVSSILLLPFFGIIIPPKRLEISLLDVMAVLMLLSLLPKLLQRRRSAASSHLWVPWIPVAFFLPALTTSIMPLHSLGIFIHLIGFYLFFIISSEYLQKTDFLDRWHGLLAVSLILCAVFVFLEKATGVSFAFARENLNKFSYVGAVEIRRYAGLFQDPQKAGQFLAAFSVYFMVLWSRKIFVKTWLRRTVLMAIILSLGALLLTVSRLAIASGFLVAGAAILFLNKFRSFGKTALGFAVLLCVVISFAFLSTNVARVMPGAVRARFSTATEAQEGRLQTWESSWHIFQENPITGIGPGNYQEYLMREDPKLRRRNEQGGYVPQQPENGYLKLLYEGGVTGVFGCLYLLGIFVKLILTLLRQGGVRRSVAWGAAGAMSVFLLTFTTQFTIADDRNALIPVIFLALLHALHQKEGGRSERYESSQT